MSLYVPAGTPPLINSALARIERRLPYAGEVIVRQGQRVDRLGDVEIVTGRDRAPHVFGRRVRRQRHRGQALSVAFAPSGFCRFSTMYPSTFGNANS